MKVIVSETPQMLGRLAAKAAAEIINEAIREKGSARVVLSTGASQFDTLAALVGEKVDWTRVEMFHLDEYVDLPETHAASFRKYLKERFVDIVHPKEAVFVNGEGDVRGHIAELTKRITEKPIDVGVIGIGENGHVAFNDPPADFQTKASYIVVDLDRKCRMQQVHEGWFKTVDDVPKQAVSMTVSQIMSCKVIVTAAPHAVKADAIQMTMVKPVTNLVPATILKSHPEWYLFIDDDSSAKAFPVR